MSGMDVLIGQLSSNCKIKLAWIPQSIIYKFQKYEGHKYTAIYLLSPQQMQ